MKKLMTAILFGAAMLPAATLTGADFRIDLIVNKNTCGLEFKGGSEGVRGDKAKWLKENADSRLVVVGKSADAWEEKSFQFTAKEDCDVNLLLIAELAGKGKVRPWVAYDNVRIEGAAAAIKNGSFEKMNPKTGMPQNWATGKTKKYVLKKGDDAADGKNYIEASHDYRAIQRIKCKKGQTVKVTFMVRNIKPATEQK